MPALPWDKFYWQDWQNDPALKLCSLAAQGLWMRMLCVMAESDPKGYLLVRGEKLSIDDMAALFGKPSSEIEPLLNELEKREVFSRNRAQIIYNRKMIRAEKKAKTARENGKNGGNPNLGKQKTFSSSDNQTGTDTHIYTPTDGETDPTTDPPGNNQKPEARSQKPDSKIILAEFDRWYAVYPRHAGRGQAEKAFAAARRIASLDDLIAGAQRYVDDPMRKPEFTKHPATWLNGKCWLDGTVSGKDPEQDTALFDQRSRDLIRAGYSAREVGEMPLRTMTDIEFYATLNAKKRPGDLLSRAAE